MGVLTVRWNLCETLIALILHEVFNIGGQEGRIITHDMTVPAICERIKNHVLIMRSQKKANPALLHAIELVDLNRINRNQLTHFMPGDGDPFNTVAFYRNKGPLIKHDLIPSSTPDIRRVADDIGDCGTYLSDLLGYLWHKRSFPRSRRPLPQRLPLPKPLWSPPQQVRKGRTPQRKSSSP